MKKIILALSISIFLAACPTDGNNGENVDLDDLGTVSITGVEDGSKPWIGGRLTTDVSNLLGGDSGIDYDFYFGDYDPVEDDIVFNYAISHYRPTGQLIIAKADHGRYIKVMVQRRDWPEDVWVFSDPVGPVVNGWTVDTISTVDHGGEPYIGLRGLAVDSNDMLYTVGRRNQAGDAFLWRINPRIMAGGEASVTSVSNSLGGAPRFVAIGPDDQAYVPRMWYWFEVEKFNTVTGAMTRMSDSVLQKLRASGLYTTNNGIGTSGEATGDNVIPFFDNGLADIAVDSSGNMYLTTQNYHGNSVLKITPAPAASVNPAVDSEVTLLAGGLPSPAADGIVLGTGTDARFRSLGGITAGPDGYVYVADGHGGAILKINPNTGEVSHFAGAMGSWAYADGTGMEARFHNMRAITYGRDGNFYVADRVGSATMPVVRKITPHGVVTTIAGDPHGDASSRQVTDGLALEGAAFANLWGIAADSEGNVYVVDQAGDGNPSVIRKIWFDND